MLCGQHVEAILSPCDHCGGLFVISARVRVCIECLRADEAAAAETLGG